MVAQSKSVAGNGHLTDIELYEVINHLQSFFAYVTNLLK